MAAPVAKTLYAPRAPLFGRVLSVLEAMAPVRLAAKWDNVGLLIDSASTGASGRCKILLTNDLTEKVMREAIATSSDMIVTYHPTPFRGIKKFVREDTPARIVMTLAMHGIAVYSPHTAMDCVSDGLNDWLCKGMAGGDENKVTPLTPDAVDPKAGEGRIMELAESTDLATLIGRAKAFLDLPHVRVAVPLSALPDEKATPDAVGKVSAEHKVRTVAVCAGSGASVLGGVRADLYLTGEMSHHDVLAANAAGTAVILTDHTNTERGFLPVVRERMLEALGDDAANVEIAVTVVDADPLVVV